jgi:rhodanese-related sulfurtransferase
LFVIVQDAYLIDVREPDEVIQGSIPSAVNLPLSTLNESFYLNPVAFKEKFGFEKPKRDQELVFYCRSGKRSASASDLAKKKGFTKCVSLYGLLRVSNLMLVYVASTTMKGPGWIGLLSNRVVNSLSSILVLTMV